MTKAPTTAANKMPVPVADSKLSTYTAASVSYTHLDVYKRQELDFEVTHDPWKLYIGERQYGSLGYGGSHGWSILQGRYISALLFEYAATLGLLDVAYVCPLYTSRCV